MMNEKVESRTGAAGWSLGLDTTLKLTTTGGGLYDLRRRRDDLRQGLYMNAENYLREVARDASNYGPLPSNLIQEPQEGLRPDGREIILRK